MFFSKIKKYHEKYESSRSVASLSNSFLYVLTTKDP